MEPVYAVGSVSPQQWSPYFSYSSLATPVAPLSSPPYHFLDTYSSGGHPFSFSEFGHHPSSCTQPSPTALEAACKAGLTVAAGIDATSSSSSGSNSSGSSGAQLIQEETDAGSAGGSARRSAGRKRACGRCHVAKVHCRGGRPCERCVRLKKSDCADSLSQSAGPQQRATASAAAVHRSDASQHSEHQQQQTVTASGPQPHEPPEPIDARFSLSRLLSSDFTPHTQSTDECMPSAEHSGSDVAVVESVVPQQPSLFTSLHSPSPPAARSARKARKKVTCSVCYSAKSSCERARPCSRCVRLGKAALCVDKQYNGAVVGSSSASSIASHTTNSVSASVHGEEAYTDEGRQSENDVARPASLHALLPSMNNRVSDIASGAVDTDELFSLALLHSHLSYVSKAALRPARMRDRLMRLCWLVQCMKPQHLQQLVHYAAAVARGSSSRRTLSTLRRRADAAARGCSLQQGYVPCDGSACDDFCPFLRAWSVSTSVHFTWTGSPQTAAHEQAGQYPTLVLRYGWGTDHLTTDASTVRAALGHIDKQAAWLERYDAAASSFTQRHSDPPGASFVRAIELCISCSVNPAFERLFGLSQLELRQRLLTTGGKALYGLIQRDEWEAMLELEQKVSAHQINDVRTFVTVVNRYGAEIACLCHTTNTFGSEGQLQTASTTFITLPGGCKPYSDMSEQRKKRK